MDDGAERQTTHFEVANMDDIQEAVVASYWRCEDAVVSQ
jgi:hypothetical protein